MLMFPHIFFRRTTTGKKICDPQNLVRFVMILVQSLECRGIRSSGDRFRWEYAILTWTVNELRTFTIEIHTMEMMVNANAVQSKLQCKRCIQMWYFRQMLGIHIRMGNSTLLPWVQANFSIKHLSPSRFQQPFRIASCKAPKRQIARFSLHSLQFAWMLAQICTFTITLFY